MSCLLHLEQGTDAWKAARIGKVTASKFAAACDKTAKGEPTAAAKTYLANLTWERLTERQAEEVFQTPAMKRGTLLEPTARGWYKDCSGDEVEQCGMFVSDDGDFAYSPDGLVGKDGLIEIKCPGAQVSLSFLLSRDPADYLHQIQGGLWLSGRQWCDLVVFHDDLPLEHQGQVLRIHRDEAFLAKMVPDLIRFNIRVNEQVKLACAALAKGVAV